MCGPKTMKQTKNILDRDSIDKCKTGQIVELKKFNRNSILTSEQQRLRRNCDDS